LTSDEILERLKEEEMEKKKRRGEKLRGRKKGTRRRPGHRPQRKHWL